MVEEGPTAGSSDTPAAATKSGNSSGNQPKTMTSSRSITSGNKHKKIIRVLTVIAYVCSVSTAAVLLSAYYIFLWNPNPPEAAEAGHSTMAMARQMETHPSLTTQTNYNPAYLTASRAYGGGSGGGGAPIGGVRSFHGPVVKKASKLIRERYYHTNHGMPVAQALVDNKAGTGARAGRSVDYYTSTTSPTSPTSPKTIPGGLSGDISVKNKKIGAS